MTTDIHVKSQEILAPPDFSWPGSKNIAVTFMIAYEGWSAGKAPGIGPMGNPLPPGNIDTNALSWANMAPATASGAFSRCSRHSCARISPSGRHLDL